MPDTSRGRGNRRYRRLRLRVLREQPLCAVCGVRASIEVDHIVPLYRGGSLMSRSNLQGVCLGCHALKSGGDRRRVRGALADGTPISLGNAVRSGHRVR